MNKVYSMTEQDASMIIRALDNMVSHSLAYGEYNGNMPALADLRNALTYMKVNTPKLVGTVDLTYEQATIIDQALAWEFSRRKNAARRRFETGKDPEGSIYITAAYDTHQKFRLDYLGHNAAYRKEHQGPFTAPEQETETARMRRALKEMGCSIES